MANIPHTYDQVFEKHRGAIPLAFMRALAFSESGLNAALDMRQAAPQAHSGALGLFQIMSASVLADWNARHPSEQYTREQLKDPDVNARIGAALIMRIVDSYNQRHPGSLRMDWTDPRYVALIALGYNAGYSEAGGIGKFVTILENNDIEKRRITVDTVNQLAGELKRLTPVGEPFSGRFVADPKRRDYAKLVAERYVEDVRRSGGAKLIASADRDAEGAG
jgi:hypothetical protein